MVRCGACAPLPHRRGLVLLRVPPAAVRRIRGRCWAALAHTATRAVIPVAVVAAAVAVAAVGVPDVTPVVAAAVEVAAVRLRPLPFPPCRQATRQQQRQLRRRRHLHAGVAPRLALALPPRRRCPPQVHLMACTACTSPPRRATPRRWRACAWARRLPLAAVCPRPCRMRTPARHPHLTVLQRLLVPPPPRCRVAAARPPSPLATAQSSFELLLTWRPSPCAKQCMLLRTYKYYI